jgi:hypothetical protein
MQPNKFDNLSDLMKILAFIGASILGIAAKIASLHINKPISKWEMLSKALTGIIVAWAFGWYCYYNGYYFQGIMGAPIVTYFTDYFIVIFRDVMVKLFKPEPKLKK